ncbi:MAG: hypothetical protein ACFB16_23125 [Phormidesmis sp.]
MAVSTSSSDELSRIKRKIDSLASDVDALASDIGAPSDTERCHKSARWIVQLAFVLLVSATVTVVVSTVLKYSVIKTLGN